jgi:hypothetical protein
MTTQGKVSDLTRSAEERTRRLWSELSAGGKFAAAILFIIAGVGEIIGCSPQQTWWAPADEACRSAWKATLEKPPSVSSRYSPISWRQVWSWKNESGAAVMEIQLVGESSILLNQFFNGRQAAVPVEVKCLFSPATKRICLLLNEEPASKTFSNVCDDLRNYQSGRMDVFDLRRD